MIIVLTMAELHVLLLVIFCLVCVAELFAALAVRLLKLFSFVCDQCAHHPHVLLLVIFCFVCVA